MGLTRIKAGQISDIDYKQAVRVITLTNISLSGGAPDVVDGINLAINDRILVAGQDAGNQNGLYYVTILGTGSNGTWVRTADGNETGEIEAGMIVMVTDGDVYKDTQWKLTTNNPIVIGTTPLTFEQNSAFAFGNIYANGTAVLATTVGGSVILSPGDNIAITGNNTSKTVTISAAVNATSTAISSGTSNVAVVSPNGNVTVGVNGTNNLAVFGPTEITFAGNLLPSANLTYSLGSSSSRWKDLWIANSSIYIGDVVLGATGSALTINGANVLVGNTGSAFSTTGNITGGNILTPGVISANGNITAGNVGATLLTGTLTTASQPNVTSVGTLTSLNSGEISSSGNITGANLITSGIITTIGNIAAGNISVTGNVQGGNLRTVGLISATGNITGNLILGNGSQLVGTINFTSQANTPPASPKNGDFWYNTFSDIKYQYINDGSSSQWVDQSSPTAFASISVGQIVNTNSAGVGNIGSAGTPFNTVFAKATSAQYADLAERYVADQEYEPGTVVVFGGTKEVTQSDQSHDPRVVGVISTQPAFIMNDGSVGLPVALTGRVPCWVQGPVARGDILVTGEQPGTAQRLITWAPGVVIGKSMADIPDDRLEKIEIAIGRF